MGNSGFNPRYPNYPKNPNNSSTQIFSLISAQSNKSSKFLNPSCRPPRPTTHPPPPHPLAARGQHPPRPTQARRSGAHGRRSPPNHLSVSLPLQSSPSLRQIRRQGPRARVCATAGLPAAAHPRPRQSPCRRVAGRATDDPAPAPAGLPVGASPPRPRGHAHASQRRRGRVGDATRRGAAPRPHGGQPPWRRPQQRCHLSAGAGGRGLTRRRHLSVSLQSSPSLRRSRRPRACARRISPPTSAPGSRSPLAAAAASPGAPTPPRAGSAAAAAGGRSPATHAGGI